MKTPLQRAREARNWTQKQVADMLKMDQGHYHRIERTGATTRETAEAIVRLFDDVDLSELHVLYPERYRDRVAL